MSETIDRSGELWQIDDDAHLMVISSKADLADQTGYYRCIHTCLFKFKDRAPVVQTYAEGFFDEIGADRIF